MIEQVVREVGTGSRYLGSPKLTGLAPARSDIPVSLVLSLFILPEVDNVSSASSSPLFS